MSWTWTTGCSASTPAFECDAVECYPNAFPSSHRKICARFLKRQYKMQYPWGRWALIILGPVVKIEVVVPLKVVQSYKWKTVLMRRPWIMTRMCAWSRGPGRMRCWSSSFCIDIHRERPLKSFSDYAIVSSLPSSKECALEEEGHIFTFWKPLCWSSSFESLMLRFCCLSQVLIILF